MSEIEKEGGQTALQGFLFKQSQNTGLGFSTTCRFSLWLHSGGTVLDLLGNTAPSCTGAAFGNSLLRWVRGNRNGLPFVRENKRMGPYLLTPAGFIG